MSDFIANTFKQIQGMLFVDVPEGVVCFDTTADGTKITVLRNDTPKITELVLTRFGTVSAYGDVTMSSNLQIAPPQTHNINP